MSDVNKRGLVLRSPDSSNEHDFAGHASFAQQLVRASCFRKWKSLCDERFDLLLAQEVEQGDQVLTKQSRLQPFERLDAVRHHPFPAGEKPAAGDVQREDGDGTKTMTAT
jgi:hypothetical protein